MNNWDNYSGHWEVRERFHYALEPRLSLLTFYFVFFVLAWLRAERKP
jgi:hypothetical protein